MKSLKYILASALTVVLALGFSSCKDSDNFTTAEKLTNAQVYFPGQSNTKSVSLSPSEDSFTIDITRRNTSEAINVPLTITGNDDNLFVVPSSVSFASGETTKAITVSVADIDTFGYDTKHSFTAKIGDESYTTPYGVDELTVTAVVAAPWVTIGTAKYRDDFFTTFWNVSNLEWDVEVQENQMTPGLYRLVYPYDGKYEYNDEGDWDDSQTYYLEIHAEDPNRVYITTQEIGVDWGYGIIYVGSYAGYYLSNGSLTPDEIEAKGYYGTLKDNVITFPTSTLLSGMPNYKSGGLYTSNNYGMFRVALPGAVLTDYSLEVAYAGKYTDSSDNDAGVFASLTSVGSDVETVKYAVVAGTDVDATVAGIIDGSVESVEAPASQTSVQVPFSSTPENGKYTIVAVSYGGGEAQEVATATFKYTAPGSESWTLVGTGNYTYTQFFGDEDNPAVDEGLELYQCDQTPNKYKIEHWGYDVDFEFTYDSETGEILVADQETGYVSSSYGTVYVDDLVDYTNSTQYGQSSYANGTFTFYVVYYVSAGIFGYGPETFTLTSAANAKAKAPKANVRKATKASKKAAGAKHKAVKTNKLNKHNLKSAKQISIR